MEVVKSSAIVGALLCTFILAAYYGARYAAPLLPFAWEKALVDGPPELEVERSTAQAARQRELEVLAARVASVMDLPPDIDITVHYVEDDQVNAFATLGGHVVVFSGLWDTLDSENARAMLLGHEIAHVVNRDPIRGARGTLMTSRVVGVVFGSADIFGGLAATGSLLPGLHFSQEQERQADADAAQAVNRLCGHFNGATDLFEGMRALTEAHGEPPAFLSSHPHLDARIEALDRLARENGWRLDGEKVPAPSS